MKREILFKAKRIDTGEWVEGFYWASLDPCSEQTRWRGHYIHNGCNIENPVEVDPKTVCQYTGLKDKNGVKIFEDDNVEYNTGHSGVVTFKFGQFYAYDGYASDSTEAELKLYDDSAPFEEGFEIVVISNIHDND